MVYIFLDESGDLGFDEQKKSTRYFCIACILTKNKRPIEKVIKKAHRSLRKKDVKQRGGILHATNERPVTRQRVLNELRTKECYIVIIYLNKQKVNANLQHKKSDLYNHIATTLLDQIFSQHLVDKDSPIQLVASRRETSKVLNENFKYSLQNQVQNNDEPYVRVSIQTPHEEKGLQVVDFVSWAAFRKLEHGDDSYYNIIKDLIIYESPVFP